jgi:DNA-directed RNA polymerase sigma subunit (sigma70/sigma32)
MEEYKFYSILVESLGRYGIHDLCIKLFSSLTENEKIAIRLRLLSSDERYTFKRIGELRGVSITAARWDYNKGLSKISKKLRSIK